jgi:RNA polymerase sigma-70 factor (ECF subfamily)
MSSGCLADAPRLNVTDVNADARVRALIEEHFSFVWRLLRRVGVHQDDADDAAQHVFMVAAAKIATIASGRERSFLVGVVLRTAATARRRQRRRREIDDEQALEDSPDPAPQPDELLERRRAREVLDEVLDAMPLHVRSVFILHEIEHLLVREIAPLLDVPEGTVASRLRRGRQLFTDRIERLRATLRRRREIP